MDGLSDCGQGAETGFHGVAPGIRHGGDGTQCEEICRVGLRGQGRPAALSILTVPPPNVDDHGQHVHVAIHVHRVPTLEQVGSAAAQPVKKSSHSLVSAHALEPTGC